MAIAAGNISSDTSTNQVRFGNFLLEHFLAVTDVNNWRLKSSTNLWTCDKPMWHIRDDDRMMPTTSNYLKIIFERNKTFQCEHQIVSNPRSCLLSTIIRTTLLLLACLLTSRSMYYVRSKTVTCGDFIQNGFIRPATVNGTLDEIIWEVIS